MLSLLSKKPQSVEGMVEVLWGLGRWQGCWKALLSAANLFLPLSLCSALFPVGTHVLRPVEVVGDGASVMTGPQSSLSGFMGNDAL